MKLKIQIWLLFVLFMASLLGHNGLNVHFLNADVFEFETKTSIHPESFQQIEEPIECDLTIKKKVKHLIDCFHLVTVGFVRNIFNPLSLSNQIAHWNLVAFDTSPPAFFAK